MSQESTVIQTRDNPSSCVIRVEKNNITFSGDFYKYLSGEFKCVKQGKEIIPKSDFMGMGYLKKRSNKRLVQFLVLTGVFSFLSAVSDKLDYLFFLNTGWFSVILNIALAFSIVGLVIYVFSKKSMIEISFMGKRICIDAKLLSKQDFSILNNLLKVK